MDNSKLKNLKFTIYGWMAKEHFLPAEQLPIFAFIYEYSGDANIATYEVLKQLFVNNMFTEFKLKSAIKILKTKGLIEEFADDSGCYTYFASKVFY